MKDINENCPVCGREGVLEDVVLSTSHFAFVHSCSQGHRYRIKVRFRTEGEPEVEAMGDKDD